MSRPHGSGLGPRILKSLVEASGTECIVWPRFLDKDGYGRVWIDGKSALAHRVAYEIARGEIPLGLTIDHLCRNRACINPAHLEPVTQVENMRRMRRDVCAHGHAMTGANAGFSKGRRFCRACGRAATVRYLAKRATA
jgi:hypothetical protein